MKWLAAPVLALLCCAPLVAQSPAPPRGAWAPWVVEVATAIILRQYDEADRLLDAQVRSGESLMWRAILRSQNRQAREAEDLFRQAEKDLPENTLAAAVNLRVWAGHLRRRGRKNEARQLVERADKNSPVLDWVPPAPPKPIKGADVIVPPRVSSKKEPEYSSLALAARLEGTVLLGITVDVNGMPSQVHVLRALGLGLDDEAIIAIRQWRFKPGTKNGVAQDVRATVDVNFRLL